MASTKKTAKKTTAKKTAARAKRSAAAPTCPNCNAEQIVKDGVVATFCHHCGHA